MRTVLKEPVKCAGRVTCSLAQAFGGPSRGRSQADTGVHLTINRQHGADEGGFPGSRPAGDNQNFFRQCSSYRLLLQQCQLEGELLAQPTDGFFGVQLGLKGKKRCQMSQALCHLSFREIISPKVHGFVVSEGYPGFRRQFFFDETLLGDLARQGLLQNRPGYFQEFLALIEEPLLRDADMPLVGGLMQHVGETSFRPQGRFRGDAQLPGNLVDGKKTDPGDIHGQAVGIFLHHFERGFAAIFKNPRGKGCADAVSPQEDHELPDVFLVLPGFANLIEAVPADAVDLKKTLGMVVDDFKGARSKAADNALGHDRPNPSDQPGTQVFTDSLDGIGQNRLIAVDLELLAEARVESPGTLHAQYFAWGYGDEIAHHTDGILASGDLYFNNGITVFFIRKSNPLNRTLDNLSHRSLSIPPSSSNNKRLQPPRVGT
jgi:hypothetical protein